MADLPLNIPPIVTKPIAADKNLIIPSVVKSASQLAREFNLENVRIIQPQKSEYIVPGDVQQPDLAIAISQLGTFVLVDLSFEGQTYTDELGTVKTFQGVYLQTVLLSINQTKEIVKTKIQGRKGTVKEYIALGDYDLKIAAIITGANGVYPRAEVQNIITMLECNQAITVTSWYLNFFNINSIVINDYSMNQDEGAYSRQGISISASSDEEENLRF